MWRFCLRFLGWFLLTKLTTALFLVLSKRPLHYLRVQQQSAVRYYLFLVMWVFYGRFKNANYSFLLLVGELYTQFRLIGAFGGVQMIGVTGSMGSGKTTLVRYISEENQSCGVLDFDSLVNDIFLNEKYT